MRINIAALFVLLCLSVVPNVILPYPASAETGGELTLTDADFEKAANYELKSLIALRVNFHKEMYPEGAEYYQEKFRLVDDKPITLYNLKGEPTAYLYLGYYGKGETPTFDEILKQAMDSYDARTAFIKKTEESGPNNVEYASLFNSVMPAYFYMNYVFYGIDPEKNALHYQDSLAPSLILEQKLAQGFAEDYFGGRKVKFDRYIWNSKYNGYLFTDGSDEVLIPFNTDALHITDATAIPMKDITETERNTVTEPDAGEEYLYKRFWDSIQGRLLNGNDGIDSGTNFARGSASW